MAASAQVLPFPSRTKPRSTEEMDGPPRAISTLRTQFTHAIANKTDENAEAAEAERYYHAVQWDSKDLRVLDARNQAPVTFNRIARKINVAIGIIEKLKQDPKAYPRTPSRPADDGAELATNVLMYALGWEWDDQQTEVGRKALVRGLSGVECVAVKGDQGDPELEWDLVDQRDFFYDPRSYKHDFSDARFMGTNRWTDLDAVIDKFPEHEAELEDYIENAPVSDVERGDERNRMSWVNRSDRSVRLVDHWFMKGSKWYYVIYCGNLALEWGESPYQDEKHRSVHKYEMLSFEIDQDGDRYAPFRNLKSPQDEVNQRRSKALHALNSRRVIADDGAVEDVDVARRELARSDGWVVKNPGKELLTEDQVSDQTYKGHFEMLQEAKNEIDSYGPNPALIGTEVDASSGRAIALLQAAGIAELGPFFKVYRNWKLRVYRKTWNAVQKLWQAPRWIRVTDNEDMAQFIQVNGWERDEYGNPVAINQLASLDVDIIIDHGSDAVSTMQDTYDALQVMAKTGTPIPPDILIEMSGLPSSIKQKLLAKLEEGQGGPEQMQAIQLKLQEVQAKIAEIESKTQLNLANAQKAAAEAQTPPTPPQIDTPADLAKANLDAAKAREIDHKIQVGSHVPEQRQPPAPPPPAPGLWDLNVAKARRESALANVADMQAAKTALEARTIAEAPPGMLQNPPPIAPGARNNNG
jgi:hypothetical protein